MATLEEVIAQTSEEDYFSDPIQFIIDSDLRIVSIPDRGVVAGVVGDKNVNRINFQMNRYYNGFDMSKFITKINYVNAGGSPNFYLVGDLTIKDEKLIFSWLIDSDVVAYSGTVMFSVNMSITDESGIIKQAFNTSNSGQIKALDGIQVSEYITPEEQQDILSKIAKEAKKQINDDLDVAKSEVLTEIQNESDKQAKKLIETAEVSKGQKGDTGDPGPKGDPGQKGTTFIPAVDSEGNLSWSNEDGLDNPETVNIKGTQGVGIDRVEDFWAVSNSSTDKAEGQEMSQTPPIMTADNRYLWHQQHIYFTNGEHYATDIFLAGVYGDTGPKGDSADFTLPTASTTVLGGVKVDGKTITIDQNGVIKAKAGPTITPKPVSNISARSGNRCVVIRWEDPTDVVYEGSTLSKWAGTKLVMNEKHYPTSPDDGRLITTVTTRNEYKTDGYSVYVTWNETQYYFALFPYSTDGFYNYDESNRFTGMGKNIEYVSFADGTDAEIARMLEAHYDGIINIGDYWSVGDKRTIHHDAMAAIGVGVYHSSNDYEYVIIGIEHDDLVTPINERTKAAITLQTERILSYDTSVDYLTNNSEQGRMNSLGTNAGGWDGCERRIWCNEVYKNCLPIFIRNTMKQVQKKTSSGGSSGSELIISNDYAFLPSYQEIFSSSRNTWDDCDRYEYYLNAETNAYKNPRYSSSYVTGEYWTRSPVLYSDSSFSAVGMDGKQLFAYANNPSGISPCICL